MQIGEVIDGRFVLEAVAYETDEHVVFHALDRDTGGKVAVKRLHRDPARAKAVVREIDAVATLRHPRIVRYVAHGVSSSGDVYLATEWVEGESLAQRLTRGPLGVETSVDLVLKVAEAIAEAHARSLVHLDLKPAHVLLEQGIPSRPFVLDFGLARYEPLARDSLSIASSTGTPGYIAPERVRGEPPTPRADVFALGCILYACLTGKAPFRGGHPLAVLARLIAEPPRPVRSYVRDIDPALEALLDRLLAKDPAERPADAREVAQLLSAPFTFPATSEVRPEPLETLGRESRALEDRPDHQAREPFVGRERELATLTTMLDDAMEDGAPVVAVVSGEPGMGKTRLLRELCARATRTSGARVEQVGDELGEGATLAVVDAADERAPGVLKRIVTTFLERPAPGLLVIAGRPDVSRILASLEADPRLGRIGLGPISTASARRYVAKRLGDEGENAERIVALGAGVPRALERIVDDAIARLDEPSEATLCTFAPRLDAQPLEARRILRAASVFGESFTLEGLLALLPDHGRRELAEWLSLLVAAELLVQRRVPRYVGSEEYAFVHPYLARAAYATLTDEDRRTGHRLALAVLGILGETDHDLLELHRTMSVA